MFKILFVFALLYLIIKAARNLVRAALRDISQQQVPPSATEPTVSSTPHSEDRTTHANPLSSPDIEDARFEDIS